MGVEEALVLVALESGVHLSPSRTQKLSHSSPMVLGLSRPGRVGRCQDKGFFFFLIIHGNGVLDSVFSCLCIDSALFIF